MSWAASAYVKKLTTAPDGTKITRSEKMLLFVLADYYNDEQHAAWASMGEIAKHALLSVRQAQRLCKALVTRGVLELQERIDPKHGQLSNLYALPSLDFTRGDMVSGAGDMVSGAGDMVSGAGDILMSGAGDIAMSPNPLLEPPIGEREETNENLSLSSTHVNGVLLETEHSTPRELQQPGKKKKTPTPLAPDDWIWIELEGYRDEFDIDALNDEVWWLNLANSFPDFSKKWVTLAFADLSRWLDENPKRYPRNRIAWKRRMTISLNFYYEHRYVRRVVNGHATKTTARY